jgi:hypothetical protein
MSAPSANAVAIEFSSSCRPTSCGGYWPKASAPPCAAAHGDHDVGGPDHLVGPRLGVLGADVDAAFGHRGDRGRVDRGARFGPAGPGDGTVTGEVGEEAEGHL